MKPAGVLLFPVWFAFVWWPRTADKVAREVQKVLDLPGKVRVLENKMDAIEYPRKRRKGAR